MEYRFTQPRWGESCRGEHYKYAGRGELAGGLSSVFEKEARPPAGAFYEGEYSEFRAASAASATAATATAATAATAGEGIAPGRRAKFLFQ